MYHKNIEDGLSRGRILLMDDDRFFSLLVAEILKDGGFDVAVARTGEEAVSHYRSALEDRPFDAVILDINVRNGMGAGATIQSLTKIDPYVKAIVSSASHTDELMEHFETFGFKAALPKPYTPAEVWEAVSKAINSGE